MTHLPRLNPHLLIFLIALFPINIFGQDDVPMFSPSPHGAIDWFRIRPNFYDTKLTDEQKALLAPLPEDRVTYEAFLKQKNTGIFRIHPRGKYEITGRTISVADAAKMNLPILGGGAYYSFTEKTNKLGPWSDIYLENNRLYALVTGKTIGIPNPSDDLSSLPNEHGLYAGRSRNAVGILTELGDVPLAAVNLTTPGLDYLTKLAAPKKYADLVELSEKTSQGFTIGQFTYRSASDVRLHTTYALRSMLYKRGGLMVFPNEPYYRLRLFSLGYDGSDILVAFRIIRRHEDGSLTILWKRLQSFEAAKIKDSFQQYTYDTIKQLLDQQLVKGMSYTQVMAFLDANHIEHTEYVETSEVHNNVSVNSGTVIATIPKIERGIAVTFDLHIQFVFNDKRELVKWVLKKSRK